MTDLPRLAFRPPEVARMLGVSRTLVYEWIAQGVMPSITVGGTKMVPKTGLDEWIAANTRSGRR